MTFLFNMLPETPTLTRLEYEAFLARFNWFSIKYPGARLGVAFIHEFPEIAKVLDESTPLIQREPSNKRAKFLIEDFVEIV